MAGETGADFDDLNIVACYQIALNVKAINPYLTRFMGI